MAEFFASPRIRRTPFTPGVEVAGVKGYTVYNHMLLPTAFDTLEADCAHLKQHVQVWDVACERQVRLRGPDARRLAALLTPRDISGLSPSRCLYIPVTDDAGGMLNDPVLLEAGPDELWISIADSDLLMWVRAIAFAKGFEVEVDEPDVSPLAIQGPKSNDLAARVFGDGVRELRFFGCGRFAFAETQFLVARSGYSGQDGFEVYVEGGELGMPLWDALMEAGRDLEVRAGCPNLIDRVEAGLLSYGNDITRENTPLECGMDLYVSDARLGECIGGEALRRQRERGVERMIRAVEVEGAIPPCDRIWPLLSQGRPAGRVSSAAYAPERGVGVAVGMVERAFWDAGTELELHTHDGVRRAKVRAGFWNAG